MRKIYSRDEQREFCTKWRASGLSQKVFCTEHGFTTKSLARWLSLLENKGELKFLEVVDADKARPIKRKQLSKPISPPYLETSRQATAHSKPLNLEVFLPSGIRVKATLDKSFGTDFIRGLL